MPDHTPSPTPPARSSRQRFERFRERWRREGRAALSGSDDETGAANAPVSTPREERRRNLRRYRDWLRPFWRRLGGVLGLGLGVALLDAAWPICTGWMINVVAPSSEAKSPVPEALRNMPPVSALWILAGVVIVVMLVSRLLGLWRSVLLVDVTAQIGQRLRARLYERFLHLPLVRLHAFKSGGVISRLSGDVDATSNLVQQGVISPLTAIIRLLVVVAVLLWISWPVTCTALGLLAIIAWVYSKAVGKIRPIFKSMRQDRARIDGRVGETMGGIRVVRSFARESREELAYAVGHNTVIRKQIWARLTMNLLMFFWDLLLPMVSLIVIGIGGWLVLRGQLTVGEIFTIQVLAFQVLQPVLSIVQSMTETQRGLAGMDRVYEVLEMAEEKPDRPDALDAPPGGGELRFEGVWFSYRLATAAETGAEADGTGDGEDAEEAWVLRDIDVTIPAGSTVALVGASGAGKSTFTDLVARFYDPQRGRITLADRDLRDYRLHSVRDLIGLVQQEVFLFDGTVAENLGYGLRAATPEAIVDAARRANALEFIERLERGFDTVIGERGVKLSGGQRQRLSIARAILADPTILILDEATSNLDSESEQLIQASLRELTRDRTTIIVAHRLSTVRDADLILVLDDGRIVQRGRHLELLAAGPGTPYHDMVQRQQDGALLS